MATRHKIWSFTPTHSPVLGRRTDTNTHHVLNGLTVDSLVLAQLEGENKGEGKREREREEEKQVKKSGDGEESGKESSGQVGIVFIYLSTCIVSRLFRYRL